MARKEITKCLQQAVVAYYAKLNHSSHCEFGVLPWGKRRLDVYVVNMKNETIGVEIKSDINDYRSDKKWREYLPFVNKFYFCVSYILYEKLKDEFAEFKSLGVGVLMLTQNGSIVVKQKAKKHKVAKAEQKRLDTKCKFFGGLHRGKVNRFAKYKLPE